MTLVWNIHRFVDAIPFVDTKYHWRIKVLKAYDLYIGLIQANKCHPNDKKWWESYYGYSYFQHGVKFHNNKSYGYGDYINNGDIIEMILDYKDNYDLSFKVNGEDHGRAFKINTGKTYKLAICLCGGEVCMLSFHKSY